MRFESYLRPSIPISPELSEIFISNLVITLDLLRIVTKYCKSTIDGQNKTWRLGANVVHLRASELRSSESTLIRHR